MFKSLYLKRYTQKILFSVKLFMAEFLSPSDRADIAANLLDLHDTFGRDIIVYKEAQKVIISTDPNYNYLYEYSWSSNT